MRLWLLMLLFSNYQATRGLPLLERPAKPAITPDAEGAPELTGRELWMAALAVVGTIALAFASVHLVDAFVAYMGE